MKLTFDKDALIREYNLFLMSTGLRADEVALGFGGAMVMHGLRKTTSDLDLDVPAEAYKRLVEERGLTLVKTPLGICADYNSYVSIHPNLPDDCIYINGVLCYNPERLRSSKINIAAHRDRSPSKREQDNKDISALESFLNTY